MQLANFNMSDLKNPAGGDGWSWLRETQRRATCITNTGMAVAIDLGAPYDVHPKNKQETGRRFALWALAKTYSKDVVCSGPLYRSHTVEGNKIRIAFDHVGGGLVKGPRRGNPPPKAAAKPKPDELELDGLLETASSDSVLVTPTADVSLKLFAIAGADYNWQWAQAVIDGDTVVVSSGKVPNPVAVRYAFFGNPQEVSLYNAEGLPASPFSVGPESP
jgi:sialate O-acetylesterase